MFSRLTRCLDRLIPFDFEVEHISGWKLVYRTSFLDTRIVYHSMFTVAKTKFIQSALGYKTKLSEGPETVHNNHDKAEISNQKLANRNAICKIRERTWPLEGERSCNDKPTNQNSYTCICRRSREKPRRRSNVDIRRLVEEITNCKHSHTGSNCNKHSFIMDKSIRKLQKFLERQLTITSS